MELRSPVDYSSLSKNIGEYLLEKPQKRVFFNGVTCVALIAAICWIYWGTRYFAFVTFDDGLHIVHNPAIRKGFSWEGVQWAFTTVHGGNWHPLTWLSFLLDYERHGLRGGGYHWTNVLIHILNSLILFRVLSRMTSQAGKSAFVAALFAVHPLHVESVAWISERKDVLSATFAFLVLDRYVTYIRHKSAVQSLLVFILYGLGLMSKAMLVSLPILMLLLDYWPLRRYESRTDPYAGRVDPETFSRLMLEKAPLFALALLFSWVTYRAQLNWNAVVPLDALPIDARVGNALVSYTAYLGKMVWPANLSIFYPYERTLSA